MLPCVSVTLAHGLLLYSADVVHHIGVSKQRPDLKMNWNAKTELIEHIEGRKVKYAHIVYGNPYRLDKHGNMNSDQRIIAGTLEEVLPLLDFEYDDGYGSQELFGYIWYEDGSWSERGEYDGSEWWRYQTCPPIPAANENPWRD